MNRVFWGMILVAVVALAAWGCQRQAEGPAAVGEAAEGGGVVLCGGCGQVKGSAVCCEADAAKCEACGLAKGSPGCCKIEKGTDVTLCAKCGQIAGSDVCCLPDAEKCEKCSLAKGSPGCCKIEI